MQSSRCAIFEGSNEGGLAEPRVMRDTSMGWVCTESGVTEDPLRGGLKKRLSLRGYPHYDGVSRVTPHV